MGQSFNPGDIVELKVEPLQFIELSQPLDLLDAVRPQSQKLQSLQLLKVLYLLEFVFIEVQVF